MGVDRELNMATLQDMVMAMYEENPLLLAAILLFIILILYLLSGRGK